MSRIVSAWRTPVPPLVRAIAIGAVIASSLLIAPRLITGPPSIATYVLGFVIGAATVVVVLLAWQLVERLRQ